jgi:outer membrane lipoprotein-sorting protein
MNCDECKLEIANLFGPDVDKTVFADVMEHIQVCGYCSNDYQRTKEVFTILKPGFQPNAPFALKRNIIHQLKMEEMKMKNEVPKRVSISSRARKIISIAAVLAVVMLIIPIVDKDNLFSNRSAKAAGVFIESSIKATQLIKSMVIKLRVRTVAHDNFALVGTEYDLINHTVWKSFDEPANWRVDKGERIVVCDGKSQYLWATQTGDAFKADKDVNFIEWFRMLLEPENILMKEQNATNEKGSKISMNEKNGELLMTITSKAQGNFINDYCKNGTIDESDNRREYTFDSNTKLLKALKIFILDGKKETLVLVIDKIDYNVSIDPSLFAINLPSGLQWQEITQNYTSETFKNISSRRAAELFFEGMANNNWKLVDEACDFFKSNTAQVKNNKEYYGGLKVISIGEPFKSGLYPGEFVPYAITLKTGEVIKMNLTVRNDNPSRVWRIDGGL